jgi:imidazolonepropionase-like amidohydrolase
MNFLRAVSEIRARCSHGAVRRPEEAAPKMQTPDRGVATTFVRWILVIINSFRAGVAEISAATQWGAKHEVELAVGSEKSNGNVWGQKQRISVEESLRAQTLHGAYGSFEEHDKGSIERGKLADLVVLGRDPLREDPSSLISIPSSAPW